MGETQQKPVVWVTGGAGYIGSNIVRHLIKQGCLPVIIDNLSSGSKRLLPPGCYTVDLEHFEPRERTGKVTSIFVPACILGLLGSLESALTAIHELYGPLRSVIHCAAKTEVAWCERFPQEAYNANVIGTYNIAELALKFKAKRFSLLSSAAVYGNFGKSPASTEADYLKPINVYGKTKLDAESALIRYFTHKEFMRTGMDILVFRLFNVAGTGRWVDGTNKISFYGKPEPDSRALFPSMVRNHSNGIPIMLNEISGLFFNTSPVRDFIHVNDVAEQIVGWQNEHLGWRDAVTFNLGRGKPIKISDLLQLPKVSHKDAIWRLASREEIAYSVAGDLNAGAESKCTLYDMWLDEVRWQKSKKFRLIKSDMSKET